MHPNFDRFLRTLLLASRWSMPPLCIGLIVAMLMIIVQFFRDLVKTLGRFAGMGGAEVIVAVLKLVDLVLVGNLVLMIIGAAVETYLPADEGTGQPRPEAAGIVDLPSLKLKVVAAISTIAAVGLLEDLLDLGAIAKTDLMWQVLILLAFVLSGVLLALMDWLSARH
jgi:uncharacterized protein (TIGR00645 family)